MLLIDITVLEIDNIFGLLLKSDGKLLNLLNKYDKFIDGFNVNHDLFKPL